MTDSPLTSFTGRCLCGAVGITAKLAENSMGACHCGTCRKWGGGPLMAAECTGDVTFTGEDNIGVFASSEWAERGFCKTCGTHLFYRLKQGGFHALPVGLLDGAEKLVFDHQVFIDAKPAHYAFSNETRNLTGAELFAQFE